SRVSLVFTCSTYGGAVVNPGDQMRITLNGITNPSTPGPYTIDVATTSDTQTVTSPAFNVVAANQLTGLTASIPAPSSTAVGARTTWVANYTTSATGGLTDAANGDITITV